MQYWSNDCAALAGQLAAQRRQMQNRIDPSETLIYQMLLDRYEQCVRLDRFRSPGSFAFNELNVFDVP
jgi:hypothetical protein